MSRCQAAVRGRKVWPFVLLAAFLTALPAAAQTKGPFGGFKDSGFGRNLGYEGVVQFQGHHSISSVPGWLL